MCECVCPTLKYLPIQYNFIFRRCLPEYILPIFTNKIEFNVVLYFVGKNYRSLFENKNVDSKYRLRFTQIMTAGYRIGQAGGQPSLTISPLACFLCRH